ncbi:MAG TPA: tRNA epoxyqueuosine(34) reductase QueG [Acidimicrobiales bacterium]|nr:tRNA epoxyqueuosine(34) reductase QueG [Acidimicrobiales bacterium]
MAVASHELTDAVLAVGRAAGLDAVGVASAEPFTRAREALESRKRDGLHAGMAFTYKNPARSTDPGAALEGARAIVVGAKSYRIAPTRPASSRPTAVVARYAQRDHYAMLGEGLRAVARDLKSRGWKARVVADDNALVDREAAYRAGLGWYGKSANILLPGRGSWFVLGSVVTDAPLVSAERPLDDGCGSCRRCLDACPTQAIVAPAVVDARRCLAWIVQSPGVFPRELRVALGDRLYGCDECQEVCPPNLVLDRRDDERAPGRGVDVLDLLAADDDTLLARHGRWYIPDRAVRFLRRNALVVLGNTADGSDPEVESTLRAYLTHEDDLLRAHACWAAQQLGRADLLTLVADDSSPLVRAEL